MARTPSNMIELGSEAPDFKLLDTLSDKYYTRDKLQSEVATVVMFICNHCPFVLHVNSELVKLSNFYQPKGIKFVAISSNDVENYPEDSPEKMKIQAKNLGYRFPYLYDETQEVAKAFDAACTPDFFIYNKDFQLVYRGQLDDSRPGNNEPLNGKDIRAALDNLLENKAVSTIQKPSIGCNIKWKS